MFSQGHSSCLHLHTAQASRTPIQSSQLQNKGNIDTTNRYTQAYNMVDRSNRQGCPALQFPQTQKGSLPTEAWWKSKVFIKFKECMHTLIAFPTMVNPPSQTQPMLRKLLHCHFPTLHCTLLHYRFLEVSANFISRHLAKPCSTDSSTITLSSNLLWKCET